MGDDYSMGSALDLAGRAQELVTGQKQAAEQAVSNVQQAQGANPNQKKAAWIKASSAKFQAARAQLDVKQAGAERNFAVLKTLMNMGLKLAGQALGGLSEKKTDLDRARAATENGASAVGRLSKGGAHDQAVSEQLDFSKQGTEVANRRQGINAELATLQDKHANNEPWSLADQQLAKNLRQEDMNLQKQGELLAAIAQAQANGSFANTLVSPQSQRFDESKDKSQANVGDYLNKQGFNPKQVAAMKEYSALQESANELRTERTQIKSQLQSEGQLYTQATEEQQDPFMNGMQTKLNAVMHDQEDVRIFDSAASYVGAVEDLDRLKKRGNVDPAEMFAAEQKVSAGAKAFGDTKQKPMNQTAGWEVFSTVMGDMFGQGGMLEQLRSLNKQYAQAQAQLSAASSQAGDAMEQARDMELS